MKAPPRQRFIGIDGESVDNRYVLLAAADDAGWSDYIEPQRGEHELSTDACLRFIARLPKGIVWGFAFSYDVNMILWECKPTTVRRLYETGRCYWRQYSIEYVPKKMLRVIERDSYRPKARRLDGSVVWDMFPWQQTAFATWLEDEQLATPEEIERIRTMKHRRATFSAKERREIIGYCLSECEYLARGARKMVDTITASGLKTGGRYYSPASLAKAAMKQQDVAAYMKHPPPELRHAVEEARFGGRAEVGQSGPIEGPVLQYDIRSAYPSEMWKLPCLDCARWEHELVPSSPRVSIRPLSLCKVTWRPYADHRRPKWGPFPMRGKIGSLRFPSRGSGWYWGNEVIAAMRHSDVTVTDLWHLVPCCEHRPFAYVPEMYAQRQTLKRAGDPSEYVLKLALNSTYGALAERPHKQQRRDPPWRCLIWAGLITAGVRARMLDVLTDDVVMIATDGIFSTRPLNVAPGDGLGEWELTTYDDMWIAGTGFYFPRVGGEWLKPKTRGFAAYDIDRDKLIGTWKTHGREGKYVDTRRRFIGMGTAFHRCGGMWPPQSRLWRHFIDEPVAKTFNLAPRRAWLTKDLHDGRSVAPSLTAHRRMAREDVDHLRELQAALEKERDRLTRTIARCDARGIPLSPHVLKRIERFVVFAKVVDTHEFGVDGSDLLARGDQPMGVGDGF